MNKYKITLNNTVWKFTDLADLMAKASPHRSGDILAEIASNNHTERAAAQNALSDVPLKSFLNDLLIPYEKDEISRLIVDEHDWESFAPISSFTVGDFRNWLLSDDANSITLQQLAPGLTPEMVSAVSKIMINQDLILTARKCEVITSFRGTIGLPGTMSTLLQPNHPSDDPAGIAASILDGLFYGNGDAAIAITPSSVCPKLARSLTEMLNELIMQYEIPTQSCVLTNINTSITMIEQGAPVDLIFQAVGGTEKLNKCLGISLSILKEAHDAADKMRPRRNYSSNNHVMFFETEQGSALSVNAHYGVDQLTCEARAYGLARKFKPFLVSSVAGLIGPQFLFDGKQVLRAGLENHFCGKLLGLPMGCKMCCTSLTDSDLDDMDVFQTILAIAGVNFLPGITGRIDITQNYQTSSFHDALYLREILGKTTSPEFNAWLEKMGIFSSQNKLMINDCLPSAFSDLITKYKSLP